MWSAEIVVRKDGKEVAAGFTSQPDFAGFEGAVRDAAGQAVYEAKVKVFGEDKQADPQQPEAQ